MAFPPATQTVAMIVGTVAAAAGLNLGVLTVTETNSSADGSAPVAVETEAEIGDTQFAEAAVSGTQPVPFSTEPTVLASEPEPASTAPTPSVTPPLPASTMAPARSVSPAAAAPSASPVPALSPSAAPAPPVAPARPVASPKPAGTEPPRTTASPTTARRGATQTTEQEVTTPTSAAPQSEYLTYNVDGVSSVVLALHDDGRLQFSSAQPGPGWVYRLDDDRADLVKIKFRRLSDGEEAEFEATLRNGELRIEQED